MTASAAIDTANVAADSVTQIAQDLGHSVVEKAIIRSDLYLADEVFMCGTAAEVTPLRSIDDHKVYQEVQGRRTIPLLQAYDYPYKVIDKPDEIEMIPDAYEWHRLQKRPFVLFLTKKLLGTNA